ncbi:MAG: hypothetical protein AAFR03_07205 [Pseudomonadota bacterium]
MGFKISILLIPLNERSLAEVVKSVYGKGAHLEQCSETVETALYPDDQKKAYACEEGGNVWIFDWVLVPSAVDSNKILVPDAGLFYLHSVTNGYAFMILKDGDIVRRRFGGSDEGIAYDEGDLLDSELKAITEAGGNFEEMKAAWLNDEVTIETADYEHAHDTLGEEMVFAVLEDKSAIHLSKVNERSERFYDQSVFEIRKPSFLSRLLN